MSVSPKVCCRHDHTSVKSMRIFPMLVAVCASMLISTGTCLSASQDNIPDLIQSIIASVSSEDGTISNTMIDRPTQKALRKIKAKIDRRTKTSITAARDVKEVYVRLSPGRNWNIVSAIAKHDNGQSDWKFYQNKKNGIILRAELLEFTLKKLPEQIRVKVRQVSRKTKSDYKEAMDSPDVIDYDKPIRHKNGYTSRNYQYAPPSDSIKHIGAPSKRGKESASIGTKIDDSASTKEKKRQKEYADFLAGAQKPKIDIKVGSAPLPPQALAYAPDETIDTSTGQSQRIIEIPFVTTRERAPTKSDAYFSGSRGKDNIYGLARVRIPEDHKIGKVELPSYFSIFGINLRNEELDERKHFSLKSVYDVPISEFDKYVNNKLFEKPGGNALVFVHGFNTDFRSAIYRTAQIAWDVHPDGLVFLFSWPSNGQTTDYLYDKDSAYGARDAFIQFLRHLRNDLKIDNINVIAHSMGNVVVLDALANYSLSHESLHIDNLIMAAPDIDKDQFISLVPKAKSIVSKMTLYASSSDRALTLSKMLTRGIARAGDIIDDKPIILPGLESIDVTAIGEEFLGLNHNTFASTRSVMNDIGLLLRGLSSPRLSEVRGMPLNVPPPQFFRFMR